MGVERIKELVGSLPHMNLRKATAMTQFIQKHNINSILELGFCYGVSTCYMAEALQNKSPSSIVTIDLHSAQKRQPNIEDLLDKCSLSEVVEFYYEPTSYNWRLMKFIESGDKTFDLCYIDGGHDWYNTGYAFFLVDKLLNPGGWLIFDDLDWSMKDIDKPWALKRPPEEKNTAQVRKVWELLVKQHSNYHNFSEEYDWGYAQKKK